MDPNPVFAFDGGDLAVFPDLASAERGTEVYDIQGLDFFSSDGTRLAASAEGYAVTLEVTAQKDPDELRSRLRDFLSAPVVGLDPGLADDPPEAARAIMNRGWPRRRRR
jgi:hypothetical protein